MKRWIPAAFAALACAAALAQAPIRSAPTDVKPARMKVGNPPEIAIDNQPERLSPGARIRGTNNLIVIPASLSGQTLPVVYRRDPMGNVHEVWLLTEEEWAKVGDGDVGTPDGYKRFAELLDIVWSARSLLLFK